MVIEIHIGIADDRLVDHGAAWQTFVEELLQAALARGAGNVGYFVRSEYEGDFAEEGHDDE